MTTTSKTIKETVTRFEKSMQDLKAELCGTVLSVEDENIRDDWDMKTLLIMLSECLVIMGVLFEATGTCVKMYGCRIRLASEGSPLPAARTPNVVSYPELPLTKAASPGLSCQTPKATIPPPGPKKGRKFNPKGPTTTGGQCGPQPPLTPAVPTPKKPPRHSRNSKPNPPPEPPASQGGKNPPRRVAKENSQLSHPPEFPAAEEEEGPPVKARRGRPKKRADTPPPPARRSTRQRTRLDGEPKK